MDEQYRRENPSELDMSPEQWREKMRLCLEKKRRQLELCERSESNSNSSSSTSSSSSNPSSVRSYSTLAPVEENSERHLHHTSHRSTARRRATGPELPQLPAPSPVPVAVGRLSRQSSVQSAPGSFPTLPHLPVRHVPPPLSVYSNEPPTSEKEAQHRRQQRHAREVNRRAKRVRQGREPVCYDSDEDALAEEVERIAMGKTYRPETHARREERLKEEELRWRDFVREVDIQKYGRALVDARGFCQPELVVVWGQGVFVRDEDLMGEWTRVEGTGASAGNVEVVPLTAKLRRRELRAYRAGVVQRLEDEARAEADEAAKWPAFMSERKLAKFVPKDHHHHHHHHRDGRLQPGSSTSAASAADGKLSRSASTIY
jgi:hypothetical protein